MIMRDRKKKVVDKARANNKKNPIITTCHHQYINKVFATTYTAVLLVTSYLYVCVMHIKICTAVINNEAWCC